MFDIGFFELAIIGVVLLVVMGPEKLPEVARQGAFFIRKARAWLTDMKSEMDTQTDGGLGSLKEATREIAELKASLTKMGQDVMSDVDNASNQMQDSVADVENDFSGLNPEEYFNKLVNDDVEPSLVDDDVAGKPAQTAKKVTKKAPAKKTTAKKTVAKKVTKKAPTVTKTTKAATKASSKTTTKKVTAKKATATKKTVAKKKAATPRKTKTTEKS